MVPKKEISIVLLTITIIINVLKIKLISTTSWYYNVNINEIPARF